MKWGTTCLVLVERLLSQARKVFRHFVLISLKSVFVIIGFVEIGTAKIFIGFREY